MSDVMKKYAILSILALSLLLNPAYVSAETEQKSNFGFFKRILYTLRLKKPPQPPQETETKKLENVPARTDNTRQANEIASEKKDEFCFTFARDIRIGDQNEDAANLGSILIKERVAPLNGIFQDARQTLIFDGNLSNYLKKFEKKYGLPENGEVTGLTRAKLNSLYACKAKISSFSIKPSEVVSSPLEVHGVGSAFEGVSGKAIIYDNNNRVLAEGQLKAVGTEGNGHLPFKTILTFSKPKTEKGFLELIANNPSGLAEKDEKRRIPIRFAEFGEAETVPINKTVGNDEKKNDDVIMISFKGITFIERFPMRIDWQPVDGVVKYSVFLSRKSQSTKIHMDDTSSNILVWTVPSGLVGETGEIKDFYIRVEGYNNAGQLILTGQSNEFSIKSIDQPSIDISIPGRPVSNEVGYLTVGCSPEIKYVYVGDPVYFTVSKSGGRHDFTLDWSGTDDLKSAYKVYTTPGVKIATVTIKSGGKEAKGSCSVVVKEEPGNDGSVSNTNYINEPKIVLESLKEDTSWKMGNTKTVKWSYKNFPEHMSSLVDVYVVPEDGGEPWLYSTNRSVFDNEVKIRVVKTLEVAGRKLVTIFKEGESYRIKVVCKKGNNPSYLTNNQPGFTSCGDLSKGKFTIE